MMIYLLALGVAAVDGVPRKAGQRGDADEAKSNVRAVLRRIGQSTLSAAATVKSHTEQLKLQERLTNATEALQARLEVVYGGPHGLKPKIDAATDALLKAAANANATLARAQVEGKQLAEDGRRAATAKFYDLADVLEEKLPEHVEHHAELLALVILCVARCLLAPALVARARRPRNRAMPAAHAHGHACSFAPSLPASPPLPSSSGCSTSRAAAVRLPSCAGSL